MFTFIIAKYYTTPSINIHLQLTSRFSISAVKVFWEFSKTQGPVSPQGAVPDEGYEWKVLTAFVETARGRTILRGTRPPDLLK